MTATDLTGGCACGAIRFTATGGPKFAFLCQCRACQHMTGGGHAVQVAHDAAAFAVTGSPAVFSRPSDSGNHIDQHFCPACGSPLFGRPSRAPGIVMILAGALDTPGAIAPDRIFHHDEAQPWDTASVPEKED